MRHQPPPTQPDDHGTGTHAAQTLLRDALRTQPSATPRFRTAVWAKIDARRSPANWPQWLRGHLAGVTAATALCVFAAVSAGGWLAYQQNSNQRQQQIQLYLSSIDAHQRLASQTDAQPPALRQ